MNESYPRSGLPLACKFTDTPSSEQTKAALSWLREIPDLGCGRCRLVNIIKQTQVRVKKQITQEAKREAESTGLYGALTEALEKLASIEELTNQDAIALELKKCLA